MPFNLSQIFGGWRRKESAKKGRKELLPVGKKSGFFADSKPGFKEAGRVSPVAETKPMRAFGKSHLAFDTLVSPHISEKATMFGGGTYVFKVTDKANKIMVKKAVEERYGVKVENVNIANMPGFKKAVVKLSAGQTISEF